MSKLDVKIGLEIHVPLKTGQKLFCDCPTDYYEIDEPNLNTCPVCTGMPGAKPFPINEKALESAIMIARLLNCRIYEERKFIKRKHYNYPDLPSGYQRTSEPIGVDGNLAGVGIWEVHLEEDPGRYDLMTGRVDFNRSGVPLVEIVTAPDMKSAEDVRNFLKELMNLLSYTNRIIEVGGLMRADVNISIGDGARVEIKNINSIKGAYKAISYEIMRQKNLRKMGRKIKRETRGFNEKSMITIPLRTKETEEDYRYIPDPDIPPLILKREFITKIKLPETPQNRRIRLIKEYGISEKYAKILVKRKEIADLFEDVAKKVDPNLSAQWICREVLKQLNYRGIKLRDSRLDSGIMIELLGLIDEKRITENTGKKLLERIIDTGESPVKIVEKENLGIVSNRDELSDIVEFVISNNKNAVNDYISGKSEALNFLMGRVMKEMRGRADPKIVVELLKEYLKDYA
ncbi:MAG: Asp-tRNA(Asn)/Glu-tRNA(Gln) amidotransferase GatCAB subunit B [Candidatus Altiarchaeales archaeon]|nr:MAG: Asp-tRNA(Asn)/Glu-tRNA(Gln) amidotransferase GatCAB subunit B [Candidatus Altiarchaeales archaeon]RLI94390.1 MAG: Asp-tRNA(Asn)/Glu-tRNA(Gln) amidotransferase GatCAB subunit B [Candidatus Altiarchaeales archaeon]RLI94618.1 MAG: Asp-tRNA(Asn)/Glu-tRNA(Gln) amidotransferase GatCAB subunit B [Candidatus Altiarchaeales archaeon]